MSRTILLFALGLGLAACSVSDQYTSTAFTETQACSAGTCAGAAPTAGDGGASLISVDGFRLSVCATSGQTLSGAGSMQAWWCDSQTSLCYRNPGLDQNVTASGARCQTFPDFKIGYISSNADTVTFESSGVTVSGGAALTEKIYTHGERYK